MVADNVPHEERCGATGGAIAIREDQLGMRAAVAVAISVAVVVGMAMGTAEFDGDPYRGGFGEKSRQATYDFRFERASGCLVGH